MAVLLTQIEHYIESVRVLVGWFPIKGARSYTFMFISEHLFTYEPFGRWKWSEECVGIVKFLLCESKTTFFSAKNKFSFSNFSLASF